MGNHIPTGRRTAQPRPIMVAGRSGGCERSPEVPRERKMRVIASLLTNLESDASQGASELRRCQIALSHESTVPPAFYGRSPGGLNMDRGGVMVLEDETRIACAFDGVSAGGKPNLIAAQAFTNFLMGELRGRGARRRVLLARTRATEARRLLEEACKEWKNPTPPEMQDPTGGAATAVFAVMPPPDRKSSNVLIAGAALGDAAAIIVRRQLVRSGDHPPLRPRSATVGGASTAPRSAVASDGCHGKHLSRYESSRESKQEGGSPAQPTSPRHHHEQAAGGVRGETSPPLSPNATRRQRLRHRFARSSVVRRRRHLLGHRHFQPQPQPQPQPRRRRVGYGEHWEAVQLNRVTRCGDSARDSGGQAMYGLGLSGEVAVFEAWAKPGDWLLLTTDGVTDNIVADELSTVLPFILRSSFFDSDPQTYPPCPSPGWLEQKDRGGPGGGRRRPPKARLPGLTDLVAVAQERQETAPAACTLAEASTRCPVLDYPSPSRALRRLGNYLKWVTAEAFEQEELYYQTRNARMRRSASLVARGYDPEYDADYRRLGDELRSMEKSKKGHAAKTDDCLAIALVCPGVASRGNALLNELESIGLL